MTIIAEFLYGNPYDLANGLDELRDRAFAESHEEAHRRTLCFADALDCLSLHSDHAPEPREVADLLSKDRLGDYEAVTTLSAMMTVRAFLDAEVEADLSAIARAIHQGSILGFEAKRLYGTCAHGDLPHDREIDLQTGTLFEWTARGGAWDNAMLRVSLSGGTEVWVDLAWVD